MNKYNNIDKIFRDSLEDYNVRPPEDAWPEIEKGLQQTKKKRILPPWFKIAAGIALLVGSYTLVDFILKDNNTNESGIPVAGVPGQEVNKARADTKTPGKQHPVAALKDEEEKNVTRSGNRIEPGENNAKSIPFTGKDNDQKYKPSPGGIPRGASIALTTEVEELAYIAPNRNVRLENGTTNPLLVTKGIEPAYTANNDLVVIDNEINDHDRSRGYQWIVGGSMAPIHAYRDLKKNGDEQAFNYFNGVETPILSYTGGFSLEMKTSGRLSIASGLYFSRLGQTVENLPLVASNNEFVYNNLNSKSIVVNSNSAGPIFSPPAAQQDQTSNYIPLTGYTKKLDNFNEAHRHDGQNGNTMTGELKQYFEYLEIPMIIKYKFIDQNIGVSLLGGVSANILVGNDVMLVVNGDKLDFGETGNIKNFNYSSSVGLGFDYSIINHLNLSVDPVFKYYLTSIDEGNNLDYHPYSLGIYTGITYTF